MESKIVIKEIQKTAEGLSADITIEGNPECVNVIVSENFRDDVVTDRIDAFVWGFIFFAMCKGYDIESNLPISEELYYNLEYHFIDGMSKVNDSLHRIHIKAPLCAPVSNSREIVSTGISCGVDSLYTIAQHTEVPKNHQLNTMAFFNAGSSFNPENKELDSPLLTDRVKNAKDFSKDQGYKFLYVESNIHLLIHKYLGYSHVENNTYMALFCVYHLQNKIRYYYYSSGYSYSEFTILRSGHNAELDSEHYDLLILQMASINGMKFLSTGGNLNRFKKTRKVANYEPSYRYLNVCVNKPQNDSTCFKCVRTMLTLDALGVLEKYSAVFDVDYYKKNRKRYIEEMYVEAVFKHNSFYNEILPSFKSEITMGLRLSAICRKICSMIRCRI